MTNENDFTRDLSRLDQIRRAHASARPTHENPAWLNSHHDEGFLLSFIDRLWNEYSRTLAEADRLRTTCPNEWCPMCTSDTEARPQ